MNPNSAFFESNDSFGTFLLACFMARNSNENMAGVTLIAGCFLNGIILTRHASQGIELPAKTKKSRSFCVFPMSESSFPKPGGSNHRSDKMERFESF